MCENKPFYLLNILFFGCIGIKLVIYIIEVHKDYTYTVQVYSYIDHFLVLQNLEEETSCGHITIFKDLYI